MSKQAPREFKCIDENGNFWKLSLDPQEKYPGRFDLKFYFNEKIFKLQHLASSRDAKNLWELLKMIAKNKNEEE